MSFFSGNRQGNLPGPMVGNPLNGLCEKAVIQTRKVFDACMKQIQQNGIVLNITNLTPANPTYPLTFVSCSANTSGVTLTNVLVDRFDDKPCFARVSADASIPITINYTDANGVAGSAVGNIPVSNDVVLYVPQPSIVPYQVEAFGGAICSNGSFTGDTTVLIDACITLVLKIVVEADILVPTYGYAQIPPCQEFSQEACTGFFDLPLFPAQQPVTNN